jgi:small-conductance mechanosensitive channel
MTTPAQGMAGTALDALAQVKARMGAFAEDLIDAPLEFRGLGAALTDALMSGSGVRAVTYALILLLVGCGAEWLYRTYAYSPLKAIEVSPPGSPRDALRLALRRFALLGFGLALFAVATIGASAAFSWPPGVHDLVVTATLAIVAIRVAALLATTLLAPGWPHLRLVAVDSRRARWLCAAIVTLAALAALGALGADLLERAADLRHGAGALRLAAATLIAFLLLAAVLTATDDDGSGAGARERLPRFPRSLLAAILVLANYLLWLAGGAKAAALCAIVLLVLWLQAELRGFVFAFWKDRLEAAGERDAGDAILAPRIVLAVARLGVVLAGLAAGALALELPLKELAASENPAARLGFRLLEVVALALLAHVAWIALRTKIDHRLKQIRALEPGDEPSPNARLLTLLPLLRMAAAVVLIVMLALSSLWALGIEITPLLAGAGVIGVALGFGAQALVRDVIAGIFYLAEDVFRVGEYIESGSATKGTVERITLRTVALRHHNGPLHFVPYGSLGTVRNNSRDFVIEKFTLPLPIHVDSEQIRKLIKKVGESLKEDPELGPLMRAPLKGKLYRIEPGVKLFRCSFETAPGKQFTVRAQAYKRIEAKLKEAGIRFAEGVQTVVVQQPAGVAEPQATTRPA